MADTRVLHVINRISGHGGAEVSLNQMLLHLQEVGVRNALVGLQGPGDPRVEAQLASAGVKIHKPLDTLGPAAIWKLVRIIRAERPEVVHTSLFEADFWGRIAAAITSTPTLVSVVNAQYEPLAYAAARSPRRLRLAQFLDALLARHLTTRLHAISQTVAEIAIKNYRVPPSAVAVIPRGRPVPPPGRRTDVQRSAARLRAALPEDAEIILNVARVEPQKGQSHLVEAFAHVAAAHPKALLVIAGRRGNASEDVSRLIDELRLGSRVLLLGARADVDDLLDAADVFAFSSLWEGLGGAVLEAMAHEVPVVAYDIPAVRETTAGFAHLVPVGDVDELAASLSRALTEPGARSHAAAARRRVERHYAPREVATEMAKLYADLAGRSYRVPPNLP